MAPVRSILLALTGHDIVGGIASVNRCVVRALRDALERGQLDRLDVVLLHGPDADDTALAAGQLRVGRADQLRFAWQTWTKLVGGHHDLVFFDHVSLAQTVLLPLPGIRSAPSALFVHGRELDRAEGRRLRALQAVDRILVNSEFTAGLVASRTGGASPPVRVVPLCIDPTRTESWSARVGESAPPRELAVLIVGRMLAEEPGKGHDTLLEAWPRVREQVPEAELWVAGSGDDSERLRRVAQGLGVASAVRFLGRISETELENRYRRASVFAMPSQQEGFGLVYAEAMWHGLPCIASSADAGGIVVRDGETGLVVRYGDVDATARALVDLLSDRSLATRMGEAGRRRAREEFVFPAFRTRLLEALGVSSAGAA